MATLTQTSLHAIRFLAASTIALGLLPATAQTQMPMHGAPHYQHDGATGMPAHLKALNLSQEQEEKIRAIEAAHQETVRKNMVALRANRAAERALIEAPSFDEQKARSLSTQDARIMGENHLATLRFRHEIYQILTPEQRVQLDTLRKQRDANRPAKES